MTPLSELDRRLIAELRKDGRAPVSTLAQKLGVSRATVSKAIERLTAAGVIVGFTVRIRDPAQNEQVCAISFIEVEGYTTDHVISSLRGFPEITKLHTTNGGWDLVAEIVCDDLAAFDDLLRRVRSIRGVVNSETSLLLSSVVR
ncbi:Lrp/AsnC family transcriptional regulator [Gulosibacter sp. 10]|uniref:Lrp/AsnC family transcriptional regulator n=1 Tax=Gulosibacter sp. 10 TaxID=1255570 RepID=UPI00097F33C9|nr:Lrp/AsnC family transcriptional regulator [Gulosibacter sp. 10]SJM68328.1 Transcriptional regulator, AsnC family [Gulosibacter sp. 10]